VGALSRLRGAPRLKALAESEGFDRVKLVRASPWPGSQIDPLKEQGMMRAREFGVLVMVLALGSLGLAEDPVKDDDAPAETPPVEEPKEPSARSTWEYLSEKYDADSDGKISPQEYGRDETHFKRLDIDSDGFIAKAEIEERDRSAGGGRGGRGGFGGGRGAGGARGGRRGPRGEGEERPERAVAPLEGSEAPDFELLVLAERAGKAKEETKKEEEEVEAETEGEEKADAPKKLKLSSFKEERPVALIFGSYT
jgi:hypothetical protein